MFCILTKIVKDEKMRRNEERRASQISLSHRSPGSHSSMVASNIGSLARTLGEKEAIRKTFALRIDLDGLYLAFAHAQCVNFQVCQCSKMS